MTQAAPAATPSDLDAATPRPATDSADDLLDALENRRANWVTFTSSSTAKNLAALLGPDYRAKLAGVRIASIGPVTSATLKELGLEPTVVANTSNIDGLVEAIVS
jgi:uroporphyrinogen III methyltransferase/synthase